MRHRLRLMRRFAVQGYVALALFVIGIVNLPPYEVSLPFQPIWSGLFIFASLAVVGTIITPLSRPVLLTAQAMMIIIGTSRGLALIFTREGQAFVVVTALWWLIAVLGANFDRIVLSAGAASIADTATLRYSLDLQEVEDERKP